MGSGTFDAGSYRTFATASAAKPREEVFASRHLSKALDPKGVAVRESRDSADNPNSTPLIVALDVSGSMGVIAEAIAKKGLGTLFQAIFDRKPITDPHVMFMGIGDAVYGENRGPHDRDEAPFQVSQFEADNRIVEQLTSLYLEGGGGGNAFESYDLAWYFAAMHTQIDSYTKRAKRGYLFTVGDEEFPQAFPESKRIEEVFGDTLEARLWPKDVLEMAQRQYDVYHVVCLDGSHVRNSPRSKERVLSSWRAALGQKVIPLADHKLLAETIVSAIEVAEGVSAAESAQRWGNSAVASVVHSATATLPGPSRGNPRLTSR